MNAAFPPFPACTDLLNRRSKEPIGFQLQRSTAVGRLRLRIPGASDYASKAQRDFSKAAEATSASNAAIGVGVPLCHFRESEVTPVRVGTDALADVSTMLDGLRSSRLRVA
jgi:hypothetical protein